MYMRRCLRLPGPANKLLTLSPGRGALGFFAQALGLIFEALI